MWPKGLGEREEGWGGVRLDRRGMQIVRHSRGQRERETETDIQTDIKTDREKRDRERGGGG